MRVENIEAFIAAQRQGKGVLVLTGHFGNWEVATIAGIASYPEVRGRFHFVRRAIKPGWLDAHRHAALPPRRGSASSASAARSTGSSSCSPPAT